MSLVRIIENVWMILIFLLISHPDNRTLDNGGTDNRESNIKMSLKVSQRNLLSVTFSLTLES